MPKYLVEPFVGVGPVRLGMSREEVLRAMVEPSRPYRRSYSDSDHEIDAFHDNSFQVFYGGAAPEAEYIELSRGSTSQPFYRDLDVFATRADEVVAYILQDAPYDEDDWELGYTYIFPELQLSLWRPIVDEPEGSFFPSIGIGRKGYYDGSV
jgi:hypothetical protein